VDRNWIDHIDAMDQLRKGIGLRAYGQVDPVIAYKKEGFDMFDEMVERIQRTTISVLLKVKLEVRQQPAQPAPAQSTPIRRQMPTAPSAMGQASTTPAQRILRRQMPEPLSNMSSFKERAKNAEMLRMANENAGKTNENENKD